jgi:hypothetical protein
VPLPALFRGDRRSRWQLYGGLAAVVIVAFFGAALLYPRLSGTRTVASSSSSSNQPAATESAAGVSGSNSADSPSPSPTPVAGTSSEPTSTRTTANPPPVSSGPRIVYFRIKQRVKCPQGTDQGQPLILEWHATGGVTRMALSVDNPGLVGGYKTYDGPDGSDTFTNFSCGPPPGTKQTHTFTIYTVGGGAQRSKTLNITATSNSLETATPSASPSA